MNWYTYDDLKYLPNNTEHIEVLRTNKTGSSYLMHNQKYENINNVPTWHDFELGNCNCETSDRWITEEALIKAVRQSMK